MNFLIIAELKLLYKISYYKYNFALSLILILKDIYEYMTFKGWIGHLKW